MDIAVTRDSKSRIIGAAFLVLGQSHTYPGLTVRTKFCRFPAGSRADCYDNVFVADFGRSCAFGKIFCLNSIASWVIGTDAIYSQFAGLAANLGSLHTVRNGKTRIRQPFMYPFHDFPPDVLVEAGSSVAA